MSVTGILTDLTPQDGDIIKSGLGPYAMYDEASDTWNGGTLTELDNESAYMIRLSEPGTIFHIGTALDSPLTIPLVNEWNWISYKPRDAMDLNAALADLDGVAVTGDVIKSQDAFAEYVSSDYLVRESRLSWSPERGTSSISPPPRPGQLRLSVHAVAGASRHGGRSVRGRETHRARGRHAVVDGQPPRVPVQHDGDRCASHRRARVDRRTRPRGRLCRRRVPRCGEATLCRWRSPL